MILISIFFLAGLVFPALKKRIALSEERFDATLYLRKFILNRLIKMSCVKLPVAVVQPKKKVSNI